MKNNFERIKNQYISRDLGNVDFRTYGEKAFDYVSELAREAGADKDKSICNITYAIERLGHNHSIVDNLVNMAEKMLHERLMQKRNGKSDLPGPEIFKNGIIDTGRIIGIDVDAKLRIDQFSGNMVIYGQYGMGKTNLNLYMIPQLISQGIHVDIFDVTTDYRDILSIPGCSDGLILNHDTDRLNPLEPIGSPEEHLQFLWEITRQDFNLRDETKEMLFNYTNQLYRVFGVYEGNDPPTLIDLRKFLEEERTNEATSLANKRKIRTALEKLSYILGSFKNMASQRRGYSLDMLDKFCFVSYEIGSLSEDKRSWYMKLKLKQYYYKGIIGRDRHKLNRIIVVDEAKGIFSKSRIGDVTNYIKEMYTKSRSIGCWWIIGDQFATELADFTRAANCQIVFQTVIPKEIREIGMATGCSESMKLEIARLGKYKMLQKITDFPYPYQVMTHKSMVKRHIIDSEISTLMREKLARLNGNSMNNKEEKKARLVIRENVTNTEREKTQTNRVRINKNPFEELERFLRYIKNNPGTKLTDIYRALGFSARKGDSIKNKAKENDLVKEKICRTGRKGRPLTELELTEKGRVYTDEK